MAMTVGEAAGVVATGRADELVRDPMGTMVPVPVLGETRVSVEVEITGMALEDTTGVVPAVGVVGWAGGVVVWGRVVDR